MNCFFHPDRAAVGICKACGRGLCPDCAAATPESLACRNACEERVAVLNRMIAANRGMVTAANRNLRASAILLIVLGAILAGFGFLPLLLHGSTTTLFLAVMGAVFLAFGLSRLMRKSLYYPTDNRHP